MEQLNCRINSQPWKKGLVGRESMKLAGRHLIQAEGLLLKVEKNDSEKHHLRLKLFGILGTYLQQQSFNKIQAEIFIQVLKLIGYNEDEIKAVFKYLQHLNDKDFIFIFQILEMITVNRITEAISAESDIYGFVRDCLPSIEGKRAALEYLKENKTENIRRILDPGLIEIIDLYAGEDLIKERLIVFLEIECVV